MADNILVFVERREGQTKRPSLEELAGRVGISPFHFQRVFKRWVGVSPKQLLQYLTVEYAKTLLRDSESVLETAYAAGLSGSSRLHDQFLSVEAVTPGVISVEIDVKPGSFPNSINPNSKGVIPVAILTTEDFDATTVDADTVRFGPADAEKVHKRAHVEDADGDGDLDLVLHFRTRETDIQSDDTEACLTGRTTVTDTIWGCDSVRTVPQKDM